MMTGFFIASLSYYFPVPQEEAESLRNLQETFGLGLENHVTLQLSQALNLWELTDESLQNPNRGQCMLHFERRLPMRKVGNANPTRDKEITYKMYAGRHLAWYSALMG